MFSFDAWGRRRNATDWTYTNVPQPQQLLTDRGFTFHQHLDEFGLINMNGRVYDPILGRFLNADPLVQDPDNTQSYNRYSYCINNPLKYTDPSGYWFGIDDLIAAGAGFVFNYVAYGITHGDWGENALKAGGVGAVTAWLGWNTCGASLTISQYIGNLAINTAASAILPPINIPITNNFSISMSPSFLLGSNGMGVGMNIGASYRIDLGNGYYANLGLSYGAMDMASSTGTGVSSSMSTLGGGLTVGHGDYAIGLYSSSFNSSDGTSQRVGGIGIYAGKFSLRYENDGFPFSPLKTGDGGDRYRTNAVQIGWGQYSLGTNLFTGDYASKERVIGRDGIKVNDVYYPNGYYEGGNVDAYRMGALYVGYGSYRVGTNSEWVRNAFQNRFAHDICRPQPGFLMTDKKWYPYFNYQTRNPYSLW